MDAGIQTSRIPVQPQPPIRRVLYPITQFMHAEASGGIVLLLCALVALAWANSPWAAGYTRLWQTQITIGPEGYGLSKPLLLWINDGLMAVFFFVVGLEIKREVLVGELASIRQAALPFAAAAGGMAIPALLYTAVNLGRDGAQGWGIPMATDIAFALGVLALLGSRVPASLKVFLTALAIVDDLGAVLVIALFYTEKVSGGALAAAAVVLGCLIAANRLHVRHPLAYALLGLALWVATLKSGLHATIAGVALAMTIPARTRVDSGFFLQRSRALLQEFDDACDEGGNIVTNGRQQAAVSELDALCEHVQTPMQRLETGLHPWTAFLVVPLFALANAGVSLGGFTQTLASPITLGVVLGLAVGKPAGITLLSWLAVRSRVAELPEGVTWRHIAGTGLLAGIGFTMALFIGVLAFGQGPQLDAAKTGILTASLLAGVLGWLLLRGARPAS